MIHQPSFIVHFFAALCISALIVVGIIAIIPEPDLTKRCHHKYYVMWSVNRCIETTGCFTLQDDFYRAKVASQYYDANCAQYEKDRIAKLPVATITPLEGQNEASLDTGHTSP